MAMTDGVGNITSNVSQVAKRPSVYQSESAREVRARAGSIQQKISSEERNGLTRLNQILSSDQPLSDKVPRGYYLNIKV
jgi:hypothetical protein